MVILFTIYLFAYGPTLLRVKLFTGSYSAWTVYFGFSICMGAHCSFFRGFYLHGWSICMGALSTQILDLFWGIFFFVGRDFSVLEGIVCICWAGFFLKWGKVYTISFVHILKEIFDIYWQLAAKNDHRGSENPNAVY